MRLRIAWGAMVALITYVGTAHADPLSPRLAPSQAPVPIERIALPGVDVQGGRMGLGMFQGTPRQGTNSIRDAFEPARVRKVPGVGLKLSF